MDEILEFLKKSPDKWFESWEVQKATNISQSSVSRKLKQFRGLRWVNSKTIANKNRGP